MAMKMVVSMNAQGRLTVPAEARKALHIEGDTPFEIEVTEHEIILRPALVIPREDAWAYTPEHIARVERALAEGRAGLAVQMSRRELEQFIADRTNDE